MQVYRELRIGTAKPSAAQRNEVTYHLVDTRSIHEPYNAYQFVQDAQLILKRLAGQGTPAVLTGGTGLYAKALLYDYDMHPADARLARQLATMATQPHGLQSLRNELAAHAPEVSPECLTNPRRLCRAVEILRLTGQVPEHARHASSALSSACLAPAFSQFIILPPRELHRQWIAERTAAMLASGWVDEVRELVTQGLWETPTARQALGYSLIAQYLETGPSAHKNLPERLANQTWQYARRQCTWFRHQHPGSYLLTHRIGTSVSGLVAAMCAAATPDLPAYCP